MNKLTKHQSQELSTQELEGELIASPPESLLTPDDLIRHFVLQNQPNCNSLLLQVLLQKATFDLVNQSRQEILELTKIEASRYIAKITELTSKVDIQTSKIVFLEGEERKRQSCSEAQLQRKERLKRQKRKALRDAATFPEFNAAIEVINFKKYRSPFVRSRDKVSLLVLFLTGLRISNLNLVTRSSLEVLLQDPNKNDPRYFEVPSIKARKSTVYRTMLTVSSLKLAQTYKSDILVVLSNKDPTDLVFTRENTNQPLDRAVLTKSLNAILEKAGKLLGKNLKSHSFRIGHITVLIDTFGLLTTQQMIGHSDPSTTVRYARNKLSDQAFYSKMMKVDKQKHRRLSCTKTTTNKNK